MGEGAGVAVAGTSARSHASAAREDMALRRAAPGEEGREGGTGGAQTEALLVGGGQGGRRTPPQGAGPLSSPRRSLPSAKACGGAVAAEGRTGSGERGEAVGVPAQTEEGAV